MARWANEATVRLSMNEGVRELVQQLDARNPDAVRALVLRNCFISDAAELCKQISRCVGLRCLSCVACTLRPSQVIEVMLQQLRHLEHLELSLVEDSEAAVRGEMKNMRLIASKMLGVDVTHRLRRVYVEVGGDLNFELLRELLELCHNVTELHIHLVRGKFSKALLQCHRFHHDLIQLEVFTFTSELPASVPFPFTSDPSSMFKKWATICANVHCKRLDDSWSCVELRHLVSSSGQGRTLPSQLVVLGDNNFPVEPLTFRTASILHNWRYVRELCVLLLPLETSIELYPKANPAHREDLLWLSLELYSIAELNVNSYHFRPGVSLRRLFQISALDYRLRALSAPPCWFQGQSSVRKLLSSYRELRDLDVRVVSRGGCLRCATCDNIPIETVADQESSDAASLLSTSIARLTMCDVSCDVVLRFLQYCGTAVTLRLSEWRFVGSPQHGLLSGLLGQCGAIRCLVLQHQDLPINDQHLQASLFRLTRLQHLCLLTAMQVSDDDASKCLRDFIARLAELKCLHIHYRPDTDDSERRVTWLGGREDGVPLRDVPCFACCSTATFIGLVKPVNRDCVEDL